jgi:hypothetical protein
MSKRPCHIRNFTGIVFKTTDTQDISSRRYSDDFSHKFLSKRILTSGEYTAKTDGSMLSLLKQRKDNSEETKITPGTISNVVKNYILPMFTKELKSKRSKKRQKEFGLSNTMDKSFDTKEGTVYAELKLSEKLGQENVQISNKIKELEDKVNVGIAEKFAAEKELYWVRNELHDAQTMITHLNSLNRNIEVSSHYFQQNHMFIKSKYERYKKLYQEAEYRIEELVKNLQDERAINDIRYLIQYILNSIKQIT